MCAPEALFPEPFPTTKRVVPYVSNVAVDVRARGAGVASALLVKCERATRMWGYPELYLHVDVGNARTREMYERELGAKTKKDLPEANLNRALEE